MKTLETLTNIENSIMRLPVSEQIYLIERIARRMRSVHIKQATALDWKDIYGAGRGVWKSIDAQDYVNQAREERI